jgi:hypothetical protein
MARSPRDVLAANTATVRGQGQAWLEHQLPPDRPGGKMAFDGAELA